MPEIPLILGGHSFISQLGSDSPASEQEQLRIVESCLDRGIRWIDTTYQPERVALGKVLHTLSRRAEASILAWNFFTDFAPGDPVGEADYYSPVHIDIILEQLRTSYVDCLVVVPLTDPEKNQQQADLALEWQKRGYVRSLGLWVDDGANIEQCEDKSRFRFAIRPCNVTTLGAERILTACKMSGWETLATSPFFRGWELDRTVADASARGFGSGETLRPLLADLMLRFSLFHRGVDRLIVAMRKFEWVGRNLESVSKGPLTDEEQRLLMRLRNPAPRKDLGWRRLLRRFLARA
jgi:aryl-alcohol dehydrogenase-like predicted oxidoreductase